ncbi:MAG: cation:dicarboxylase symporter family transporter [Gemmatimonadetes bacterium]|nr:cation:dicarboxylase symporter family transporter [Gemmatimonadota bacterium]
MPERPGRIPSYVWTFLALAFGLTLGGFFPGPFEPVAAGTSLLIRGVVAVVPLLILAALSPAIATLVRRGLAGRFAGSVVVWYVGTSALAGLLALIASSFLFRIPFSTGEDGALAEALAMLRTFGSGGASLPLLAILAGVLLGVFGARHDPTYGFLTRISKWIEGAGARLGYVLLPLILAFGITLGVRFGARMGVSHYLSMVGYTAILCLVWWVFYTYVLVRWVGGREVGPVIRDYYVPTAVFAAGTCSSLATLPVNLANAKKVGVRDEVADFVIPFGSVANLDASALAYMAYGPFVISYVFGFDLSWVTMLAAWPAIVLFTIAAPGLPAGMGTALWSATLFANVLGLEGQAQGDFIASWIALSGGIPDMLRTATNCTDDGFTAIIFDNRFDEFFGRSNE